MKLKFLLFPFALIVATVLSIWFIWPTWFDAEEGIVAIQEEIAIQEAELSDIKNKKNNLVALKNNLDSEVENVSLTRKYYPAEKDTEKIINEVNYFATGAGVAVVDMDVVVMDRSDRRVRGGEGRFACLPVEPKSNTPTQVGATTQAAVTEGQVFVSDVKIRVLGGYEGVRNFINRLQGMELINNIHAVSIGREETETEVAEGAVSATDNLKADIGVCFGYLGQPKINKDADFISHEAFSSSSFDFDYVSKMQEMIYRSAAQIEIGATGKANPFIP